MRRLALAFLGLSLACAGARPGTVPVPPPVPPPALGVDLHAHFTMKRAARPIFRGEPGDGVVATSPGARLENQLDAAQLRSAGVRLAFAALWPPMDTLPDRTALDEALGQVAKLDAFAQGQPGFAVVHSVLQARRALAEGRIALFPQIEGGEGIRAVEDVDRLFAAGVRCVVLAHLVDSDFAGAAKGQLAENLLGIRPSGLEARGLSQVGKAAVERMIDLGILVDLAHASDRTSADALEIAARRNVPVIISHTGARALFDMERNTPDDLVRAVVKTGGLVGVTLSRDMVATPEPFRLPAHQPDTCDDVVAHWKHFASLVPPSSIALGSDFNGLIRRARPGGLCPHGLRHSGDLVELWAALEASGVPRDALDGMGEKLLGVMAVVEEKASPDARARALQPR